MRQGAVRIASTTMKSSIANLFPVLFTLLACFSVSNAFIVHYRTESIRLSTETAIQSSPPGTDADIPKPEPRKEIRCPNCDLCDGSGRITGGIGAVLDWWPIKAYRPCPNFLESGGLYQRSGQGLDEIAFGRDSTFRND